MSFGQVDNGSKASPFSIASRFLLFSINLVLGRNRIDVLKMSKLPHDQRELG